MLPLFISGFFSTRFGGKSWTSDHYVSIGDSVRRAEPLRDQSVTPVFAELAEKFVGFVDVLSEVSERTSCASNLDLLRLYERWLKDRELPERRAAPRTGSRPQLVH